MPQFNPWLGKVGIHSYQLRSSSHRYNTRPRSRAVSQYIPQVTHRRYGGSYFAPSAVAQIQSRTRRKAKPRRSPTSCCRVIRGKKYCSPAFCHKKRKIKYW